jgi:hypothetical protein
MCIEQDTCRRIACNVAHNRKNLAPKNKNREGWFCLCLLVNMVLASSVRRRDCRKGQYGSLVNVIKPLCNGY